MITHGWSMKNKLRMILLIILCLFTFSVQAQSFSNRRTRTIELTDKDRATIVRSVFRSVFNTKNNIEGTHFILTDGLRPEWIPKISKFNFILVTRQEIESLPEARDYYVIELKPMRGSVKVNVRSYNKMEKYFTVSLYYSFYRRRGNWH